MRRLLHIRALASNRHRAALGRRLGLSTNELAALAHLAERGLLTPSELGARLVVTSGGVSALVQRLERAGLVRRSAHPRDGRSSLLRPDDAILSKMAELSAPLVASLDDEVGAMSADGRRGLERFLARVTAATEREADALLRPEDVRRPGDDGGSAAGLWT